MSKATDDGRRRPFFFLEKDFPLDDYASGAVLDEFGLAGLATWVAMWAAAKRADVEGQLTYASEAEFWVLLRIPLDTPDLPDLEPFLRRLGELKQVRRKKPRKQGGGPTVIVLSKYGDLQQPRGRPAGDAQDTDKRRAGDEQTTRPDAGNVAQMSRTETETTDSDGDGDGNRPGQSVEISEDERWRLESKALAEVPSIDANGTPIKSPRAYARKKLANAAWVADQLAELRAETARERSQADLEPLDDLRERDTA